MSIWTQPIDLDKLNLAYKKTMVSHLGIELTEVGSDFLRAKMPVDERTKQPYGIMHGGASCALAESVASIAAYACIDQSHYYCVGVEINTSHIKSIKSGWVIATARPLHLGRSTQVWEIPVVNEDNQLISVTRLRMAVLRRENSSS